MRSKIVGIIFICINLFLILPIHAESMMHKARSVISISPDKPYFPVMLLLGTILAIASFYFPRFGLIVMLFFIMIATDMPVGRAAQNAGRAVSIRIEDVVLVLVSGGWILHSAKHRTLSIIKNVPVNRGVFLMASVIVLSTIIGYLQGTVTAQRGFFFALKRLEYFWIYFMTLNLMNSDKEAYISVYVMLAVSALVAIFGIIKLFLDPVETAGGTTSTVGFGRANTLADFLLIVIGIIAGLLVYVEVRTKKYFLYVAFLIITLISFVMTKSRGAYVAIPPMFCFLVFVSKNKRPLIVLLALVTVVLIYIGATALFKGTAGFLMGMHRDDISYQIKSIVDVAEQGAQADSSFYARVVAWKNIIPKALDYPIFGHGCGSQALGNIDNHYVRELYETGILGILAFFYMNGVIFFTLYSFFMHTENLFTKGLSLGFMTGQIGVLIHGITISNFYTIINMETFWFLIAILMLLYYNERLRNTGSGYDRDSRAPFLRSPDTQK